MHCELDVNDWKSCVRQKRTEGSNPSLSVENPVSLTTYGVFAWVDFKGLICATGFFKIVRQESETSVFWPFLLDYAIPKQMEHPWRTLSMTFEPLSAVNLKTMLIFFCYLLNIVIIYVYEFNGKKSITAGATRDELQQKAPTTGRCVFRLDVACIPAYSHGRRALADAFRYLRLLYWRGCGYGMFYRFSAIDEAYSIKFA